MFDFCRIYYFHRVCASFAQKRFWWTNFFSHYLQRALNLALVFELKSGICHAQLPVANTSWSHSQNCGCLPVSCMCIMHLVSLCPCNFIVDTFGNKQHFGFLWWCLPSDTDCEPPAPILLGPAAVCSNDSRAGSQCYVECTNDAGTALRTTYKCQEHGQSGAGKWKNIANDCAGLSILVQGSPTFLKLRAPSWASINAKGY